jgi:predicted SAM-dependent methyltransferase
MFTSINSPKLHLASGKEKIKGFINIDKEPNSDADFIINLEDFPWPIDNDSAEEIICQHYIEHIPTETYIRKLIRIIQVADNFDQLKFMVNKINLEEPSDGLILFMEEVYRILKPGGIIKFTTPYYQGERAWSDPTHRRAITEKTFMYFNRQWRIDSKLDHYPIKCDFEIELKSYDIYTDLNFKSEDAKKLAMRSYNNTIANMNTELKKR